jgi:hypothetical protein
VIIALTAADFPKDHGIGCAAMVSSQSMGGGGGLSGRGGAIYEMLSRASAYRIFQVV